MEVPVGIPTPLETSGWTVCRIRPDMWRAEVEARLGHPDFQRPLKVADNRPGTYVEYGNTRATWNGFPTIVYDQEDKVISVVGNRVFREQGKLAFKCGDEEDAVLATLHSCLAPVRVEMGEPAEGRLHVSAHLAQGDLELTFTEGRLSRIIFCRAVKH